MSGCLDTTVGACIQCSTTNTSQCTKCGTLYDLIDGSCVRNSLPDPANVAFVQMTYIALATVVMIVLAMFQR